MNDIETLLATAGLNDRKKLLIDVGDVTPTSQYDTVVPHNLGVVPDLVLLSPYINTSDTYASAVAAVSNYTAYSFVVGLTSPTWQVKAGGKIRYIALAVVDK